MILKNSLIMQLAYPWFLIMGLTVSVPIVIHLLQLRKLQRVEFSNNAFIREVEVVAVRHRKVQHLLLLLARITVVSALVLAFCQPFFPSQKNGKAINDNTKVNILVDNTFSMQLHGASEGSLFEEALTEARNLGGVLESHGKIILAGNDNIGLGKSAYQTKIDELKMSSRRLYSVINSNFIGNDKGKIYIFSDFQKSEFNAQFLNKTSNSSEVVLVPVRGRQAGNVYVDSVWVDDAFVRAKTNVGLHVRVRNGGEATAPNCSIKVFLGGRQAASFRVTVGAGATVTSVVQVQVKNNALELGRVVTDDNPVTFDNTHYFTLQPASSIKILEIGPEELAGQLYRNEPLFSYSFSKSKNVNYAELRQANLVLLSEMKEVDAGLQDGLRDVLKRGGSVVIVPSTQEAGLGSYQRLFRALGLGMAQWEAKSTNPELREVAMPNVREPFFREVFGVQQRAVTMPRVAPVLRWARTGTDIMRLKDGESYLAEFESGKGKVYVFSAPFAKNYSDFVSHALFVPVMYRMAMLSYRNEQLPAYRLNQNTVKVELAKEPQNAVGRADEAGFRLVKDSLTLIPVQRLLGQELSLDLPVGMDAAGFYQLQRGGKTLTTLAFNQDKRESELAAYSPDELRQLIGPDRPNIRVLEGNPDGGNMAKIQIEQNAQPLWRYFVVLALVGLLAEAVLVRFGGRGAGKTAVKHQNV